ncbi:unnamed protein product [Toxocara canis]|uniref:Major sperm protein n=1 Tax=Toxocara canis TaxID=6265 RepID=A0A183UV05_TOXCA|nr:unnamed protein product [Toxocara canis]
MFQSEMNILGVSKGSASNASSEKTALSPSSPGCALTPKFIVVEPLQVAFDLKQKRAHATIKITNMNPSRVAWRIRTNAPTRYVVMPTSGFLTANGNVTVRLTLADPHKYHHRHRFMVQAMEAKEGEKDRKKIWNEERANKLDVVQSIRIITSDNPAPKTTEGSPQVATSTPNKVVVPSNEQSTSSTQNASSASTSVSGSSESSSVSIPQKQSVPSNGSLSDFEYAKKVDELTAKVKIAMNEKAKESQKLIEIVNEVKKIEVELDRAGAQCKDLNEKVAYEEAQRKVS